MVVDTIAAVLDTSAAVLTEKLVFAGFRPPLATKAWRLAGNFYHGVNACFEVLKQVKCENLPFRRGDEMLIPDFAVVTEKIGPFRAKCPLLGAI